MEICGAVGCGPIEFQEAVGIRPASGYFGPITRNWIETH